jgi:hypothetical protein
LGNGDSKETADSGSFGTADGGALVPDGGTLGADAGPADAGSPSDSGFMGNDAGSSDGGLPRPSTLWPFAVGYRWTYYGSGSCPGISTKTIVSDNPLAGRPAFQLDGCAGIQVTYAPVQDGGDEVDVNQGGGWTPLIDPVLVEGHSWSYYVGTFTWHKEGTVITDAGTFSDCWTAVPSSSTLSKNTYCRGVGPVHYSAYYLEQWLVSKNF